MTPTSCTPSFIASTFSPCGNGKLGLQGVPRPPEARWLRVEVIGSSHSGARGSPSNPPLPTSRPFYPSAHSPPARPLGAGSPTANPDPGSTPCLLLRGAQTGVVKEIKAGRKSKERTWGNMLAGHGVTNCEAT